MDEETKARHARWEVLLTMEPAALVGVYERVARERRDLGDKSFYYEGNVMAFKELVAKGRPKQDLVYFIMSADLVVRNIRRRLSRSGALK